MFVQTTGGQRKKDLGESTSFGCGKCFILFLKLVPGKKLPVKIEGLCKWFLVFQVISHKKQLNFPSQKLSLRNRNSRRF